MRDATDMINISITDIMTYLIKIYGQIKPEQHQEMKKEVEDYVYDPTLPIDILFNKIEFFSDVSDFANKAFPDDDKIDTAYITLNTCGVFKEGLKGWNKLPSTSKTWDAFKKFFRKEHLELDKVDALSKQESSLNHAALLQQQATMFEQMEERIKDNMVDTINNMANQYTNDHESEKEEKYDDMSAMQSALSTITGNSSKSNKEMKKFFELMFKKMENLEKKCDKGNITPSTETSLVNPKNGKAWRRYCWTCGCCDHWGRFCSNRKPGHKVDATFKNRLGGSTKGVLGV